MVSVWSSSYCDYRVQRNMRSGASNLYLTTATPRRVHAAMHKQYAGDKSALPQREGKSTTTAGVCLVPRRNADRTTLRWQGFMPNYARSMQTWEGTKEAFGLSKRHSPLVVCCRRVSSMTSKFVPNSRLSKVPASRAQYATRRPL